MQVLKPHQYLDMHDDILFYRTLLQKLVKKQMYTGISVGDWVRPPARNHGNYCPVTQHVHTPLHTKHVHKIPREV